MKVTPEEREKKVEFLNRAWNHLRQACLDDVNNALQEAWQFTSIPDIIFVNNELAELMISAGCKSKKKRQRKKWAKKHGFRRFKAEGDDE